MRGRTAVAALAAFTVMAGCSAVVPGTGAPARDVPVADVGFGDAERVLAEQMAIFRSWDVCAMHDVAAAERETAAVAFAVRPVRGYDGCEIALEAAADGALSYVTIEVTEVVRGSGAPREVDARTFAPVAAAPQAQGRSECGYVREVALGWGVVVRGEVAGDPGASCALAGDYLADVLPRIDDPPRRAAAGTDPAFALDEQDPCAVLAALAPDAADVTVDGPRACSAPGLRVAFGLSQVEADVEGSAVLLPGGRVEVVDDAPDGCTVTRQASDTTLLAPSLPYLFRETLAVTTADCAAARADLDAVGLPGPVAAAPGAFALGSLEDFPTADDVGAPFDPCATVGWSAFPAAVRPPGIDPRPFPSPVDTDTLYRVGCDYSSDALASILSWGPAAGAYSTDPAARPGVATQFGGRPGLEHRAAPASGEAPLCLSTMQLGNGIAGVVTLARDTTEDLCAVNRAVLEALAPLVP
ncbi:hypothetical protein [Pseudonocardia abyssalis]|uniref:DUF3558 domain-containing protein n=1 Tax=Pseudonocardia abyssalis TaxID=2792008 RepID=A0ABS6UQQ1_9PSEU|nr:hypothetical protein [Pseudonocardia abyssalis]MBW0115731.1 hypothetical protein [Pseudonocardia abyssalis]MBW0134596.1 hypothetical protein [Pseudonocardia abyssalis]